MHCLLLEQTSMLPTLDGKHYPKPLTSVHVILCACKYFLSHLLIRIFTDRLIIDVFLVEIILQRLSTYSKLTLVEQYFSVHRLYSGITK